MNSDATPLPLCQFCGKPQVMDELLGLHFCEDCDRIFSWLPQGRTYMLLGESGVGKSILLYKFNELYLRSDKPCIYVAFDENPEQLRVSMKNFIKKLDAYENDGLLSFVDCYSCIGGLKSREKYFTNSPGDINELNLLITSMINNLTTKEPVKVFLDSATSMFIHSQTDSVLKFLFSLSAKLKPKRGSLFFTLGQGAVAGETQKKLEQMADGLIEFRLSEAGGRVRRYYKISKVRGAIYFDSWLPFFIGKESISLGHPEEPETLQQFNKIFELLRVES